MTGRSSIFLTDRQAVHGLLNIKSPPTNLPLFARSTIDWSAGWNAIGQLHSGAWVAGIHQPQSKVLATTATAVEDVTLQKQFISTLNAAMTNSLPFPLSVALTIAGSDPSGGAGLQADLKTFQQLSVYGMSVVTLITVQNTQAVARVEVLAPELIVAQLDAVLADIPPSAVKMGALGNAEVVQAVSQRLKGIQCPIVVDPVLVSKHGHLLVTDDAVEAYRQHLLPIAQLITPNRFEAERLCGFKLDDESSLLRGLDELRELGSQAVLIKLGEVDGQARHVLSVNEQTVVFDLPRLRSNNTHGAGCTLAAAITARLAQGEASLRSAVEFGIHRAYEAIEAGTPIGQGVYPADVRAMSVVDRSAITTS